MLTAYLSLSPLIGGPHGPWTPILLTIVGFLFAVWHARLNLGLAGAAWLLGLTILVSLVFETVGVATGWIYGPYHYTDALGPRFLGLVPYLIPVAWFMMVYPSRVIAERLVAGRVPEGWRHSLALAAVAAFVMTSWDLLMDPMMVRMQTWVWDSPGVYFGVPVHNYLGWLLTTFCVYASFEVAVRRVRPAEKVAPTSDAIWAYLITWAGNSAVAIEFGLVGPALVGMFTSGVLGSLALLDRQP
ncbi:MAG TPA: carotenoid biosynthesis protein [Anaerolineales bacterium]|nr:carotenoid biosynthesis protein [Anaerolineales bacterium]